MDIAVNHMRWAHGKSAAIVELGCWAAQPQGLYFDSTTNQLFIATGDGNARICDGTDFPIRRDTL
jgi:hypothetical protein